MSPLTIGVAFLLGLGARLLGLPPFVGFLLAGFALRSLGMESTPTLEAFADTGVTLLLFSIGLKLRLRTLAAPEVWAGASLHMLATILIFAAGLLGLGAAGLAPFSGLDLRLALLVAFALSFSSTVFAVRVLEDKGESGSLHGRIAVGILIIQDLIAVVFLAAASGTLPTVWALGLLALPLLRPALFMLMDRCGHGELLLLFGLVLALVLGAEGFEFVGMKADLGALVLGLVAAGHPKSSELARSLMGLKDLFLIGFFLTIGLSASPSLEDLGVALLFAALVPVKASLFFLLLTRFRLRARTSLLASFSLASYSEFGLIVEAIAVANGWLDAHWLVICSLAVAMSFVLASPLNTSAHSIYARFHGRLHGLETAARHREDRPIDPGDAEILIFGMGRIGTPAYEVMHEQYGDVVLGLDVDGAVVREQREAGRHVIQGDAADSDFWERIALGRSGRVRLVMLAMPKHSQNLYAARRLAASEYPGLVAAMARFDDEIPELEREGVHFVWNYYAEAGVGFADDVRAKLEAASRRAR